MNEQQLLPGETILVTSDDRTLTLTNFRLRYYETEVGNTRLASMHLDKLSAIEMNYKSNLLLLYAGIIVFVLGIISGMYGRSEGGLGGGIVIGIVLIAVYFSTRHHIVSISSDSGVKINFQTKGMTNEKHLYFINEIEAAKHRFIASGK